MATSFITKDNKHGFWIHDSVFGLVCMLLHDVIEIDFKGESEEWVKDIQILLDYNAKGYFHSFMHLKLDELLNDEKRKKKFTAICEKTKKYIRTKYDHYIPSDELTSWYTNGKISYNLGKGNYQFETNRLIKTLNYLEDVVNDKTTILVDDKIDYHF